ncbi:MAG: MBL fold metallo-hydrolase [Asgard group archaeon]|nr:MBL fold metallo-hydrolase [Asgard group archaeon]
MNVDKITNKVLLFTFDDLSTENMPCPTNVLAINGEKHIFVCDTFLGPEVMELVKQEISKNFEKKPIIVFNSHYDWDHHWGNCAFTNNTIISHKLTRELIIKEGEKSLKENEKYKRGDVKILLPSLLFTDNLIYQEDNVEFFLSPGHTEDSSSCFDRTSKTLFVGDNLEDPIPYIRSTLAGVKKYVDTLEKYQKLNFKILIPGHGFKSGKDLLQRNLKYLKAFPELPDEVNIDKYGKQYYLVHLQNLSTLASLLVEEGNFADAIAYNEQVIILGKDYSLINDETIKRFENKIAGIKKKS